MITTAADWLFSLPVSPRFSSTPMSPFETEGENLLSTRSNEVFGLNHSENIKPHNDYADWKVDQLWRTPE
jgi:hypothetical protein